MKKYKSGDLTHKRAEVLKEAAERGAIIQEFNTDGDVRHEFVIISKSTFDEANEAYDAYEGGL